MLRYFTFFLLLFVVLTSAAQRRVLKKYDFNHTLDTTVWVVEMANVGNSGVYTKKGKLVLDTKGGVTVWYKYALTGSYRIEFERTVLVNGGENDRLSDLNVFWQAIDPRNSNLFTRKGTFEEYDSLRMFYVGMGGNTNTTTRFRRYEGDGRKTLLAEKNDQAHLLRANKTYRIAIIVQNGSTSFWVDGQCVFSAKGQQQGDGHFGFRSTWSRQEISNFRILYL
ncbi:DUF6250 domain-containing protein [uncultured Chitinophaga sp.]|uniref:DUF6250 domain-containing protein n=1 Tax=uncultured Chitinophaga sp. TaxID=339340 RepID=UPI0025EA5B17|nr:DUF6250 domain-containing protein [uncultured Chitinophaga sp.]